MKCKAVICGLLLALSGMGAPAPLPKASVTLEWDPVDPSATEVRVYYGTESRGYIGFFTVPAAQTFFEVDNLSMNTDYFFAATAINAAGVESEYSNEVEHLTPGAPRLNTPARINNFRKRL